VDWIQDRYEPRAPSTGAVTRATRVAFSPRAGANLRYADGARQTGHVYASAGRSFKAPTMDQLFDQRRTPVPFPPFAISTSNAALEAQYGTSVEAGAYHRVAVVSGLLDARFAVSAYQMDMKDELDFDLKSFRYVNLGQSRHRGVEAGVTLRGPLSTSAFANYTQQDATSRFGENSGRFLKAVPRRVLAAGLARTPADGLALAATATSVRDVFLDDANERRLDPYTRLDARASYPLPRGPRLSLNVQNLLGREYSTTGFPDPAGSGTMYLYPAAGRVVTVGLESRW
jgi:outer membrane receptor protein involved in Fe transport